MSDQETLWVPGAPALGDPPALTRLPDPESVLYFFYRPALFLAEVSGTRVLATLIQEDVSPDGTSTTAYLAVPIEPDEADAVIACRMTVHDAYRLRPSWLFHEYSKDGKEYPVRAWSGVVPPDEHLAAPGVYLRQAAD